MASPQSIFSARFGNDDFTGFQELPSLTNSDFDASSSWLDSALGDDLFGGRSDSAKLDLSNPSTTWTSAEGIPSPGHSKLWIASGKDGSDTVFEGQKNQSINLQSGMTTTATTHEGCGEAVQPGRQDDEQGEEDTEGQMSMTGESDYLSNWVSNGDLGFESLLNGV